MKRVEAWGAELAMAIRRREDARAALLAAETAVAELEKRILSASTNDLYVNTGSFPAVPDERPTERIEFEDVPCPGHYVCAQADAGQRHMHTRDGQVFNVDFQGVPWGRFTS